VGFVISLTERYKSVLKTTFGLATQRGRRPHGCRQKHKTKTQINKKIKQSGRKLGGGGGQLDKGEKKK